MAELITGLDIGGAHLKVAQVEPGGRIVAVSQIPCELWLGLDRLEEAFRVAVAGTAPMRQVAVTMTGELADLFPDRATGVARLLDALAGALPGTDRHIWAGRHAFVDAARTSGLEPAIASANWLASATLAARRVGHGLFVDLGSTTTDVLVLAAGDVPAEGRTDRQRLVSGELVYTGLTRTALMAVAGSAPFAGRSVALANELFATMADAYRVLGVLPEDADQHGSADGGPKTVAASSRRLARMVGADFADGSPADWQRLAAWFARCQRRRIEDAIALQLSRGLLPPAAPLIGAGCGRFLLEPLALELGLPYRDFASLLDADPTAGGWAATCAPAVAVALLLAAAV